MHNSVLVVFPFVCSPFSISLTFENNKKRNETNRTFERGAKEGEEEEEEGGKEKKGRMLKKRTKKRLGNRREGRKRRRGRKKSVWFLFSGYFQFKHCSFRAHHMKTGLCGKSQGKSSKQAAAAATARAV